MPLAKSIEQMANAQILSILSIIDRSSIIGPTSSKEQTAIVPILTQEQVLHL